MSDQIPLLDVDPAARRDFDYYPTQAWMTRALIHRFPWIGYVVEPCSGLDAIADVLRDDGIEVVTSDINPATPAHWHLDATQRNTWVQLAASRMLWCVTNPPFNLADQIVPLAVEHYRHVAMMLRLSWLEPTEARANFLAQHPPTNLIVLPRHDWRGNGSTDSVTSAWFVWNDDGGPGDISIVTKAERDELIARFGAK
jgi:hypothetical protein